MNSKRTLSSMPSDNMSIVSCYNIESCNTTQKTPTVLEYSFESQLISRSTARKSNFSLTSYSKAETSCKCSVF
ncbi:unnamed protein product [Blepharisma stoltei]|uniref:Uncharacterized protein n=1 Tax=Blepharisma stoltei TaxID=1481888 RepID=A0AAU9JKY8_9CILI|nr:unnamed protein product [Blepharisma stoltei]